MGNSGRENRWWSVVGTTKNTDNQDNTPVDDTGTAPFCLFPNPCRDVFSIDEVTQEIPVYLNDALGKTVFESILQIGNNLISIGHLPAGVYFVHIGDFPAKILVVQPE